MISIIIANYNKKDLLKKCLDSIRGQDYKDIEIIVIDNASIDGSVQIVREFYPEVRLICNTKNLLFCKAYNQGIDASKGSFILCLNNDVVLDKSYLKEVLNAIGLDTGIGMVSGKILRMNRKTIDSTGLFLGKSRKPIERGYNKPDNGQYEIPEYVFGASGACMFLRRGFLKDIKSEFGYFDERFGIYYEDLDLCWRAHKRGWEAYYTPKAIAYHIRGGTAVIDNRNCRGALMLPYLEEELRNKYIKNRYRCMKKNETLSGFFLNLPFILWYEIKLWGYIFSIGLRKSQREGFRQGD